MSTRLGKLIKQKREEAGLSITQLAAITGLPIARLQDLEIGHAVGSFEVCRRLGRAFATTTSYWFVFHELWLASLVDGHFNARSQAPSISYTS